MRNKLHAAKQRAIGLARRPNARKGVVLTGLMYLSPALGLLLDNLLARHFGVGSTLDIFRLVSGFMLLGTGLVAGTLLKYAIIPELAKAKAQNNLRSGLQFVTAMAGLVLICMLPLIGVGLFVPSWLLHLLGPGLVKTSAALPLVQVATLGFALMILCSTGGAVLQFYGTFWGQPAGQVALNTALVLAVVLFAHTAATPQAQLQLLTYGLTAGIIATLIIFGGLLFTLWRRELSRVLHTTRPSAPWNAVFLGAFLALLPQLLIMTSEIIKPLLINRQLSYLEAGSIALFAMGLKLLMLSNLPVRALVQLLFPNIAKLHAGHHATHLKSQVGRAAYGVFSAMVALAVVLWLAAPYVVAGLFGLANLPPHQVELLHSLYRAFLIFAPFAALGLLFQEVGYATGQSRKVLIYTIGNVALMAVLLPPFTQLGGTAGAVYAFVGSQSLCMALLAGWVYSGLRR